MKGQYFSFDAIMASVIFVLALVALLSYWHSVRSFLDYQNDQLSKDAITVSNLLFSPPSPGPSCGTMEKMGLAIDWADRRVNSSIIDCAKLQSQAWLKEKLGTSYNVSLRITNLANGSVTTIGGDVPAGAANVVKIRRLATVMNASNSTYLASLDLSLYR
ncbi:MAG: hypothetical protein U0R44_07050 [Candidatus Micrarchaeia archaeon]